MRRESIQAVYLLEKTTTLLSSVVHVGCGNQAAFHQPGRRRIIVVVDRCFNHCDPVISTDIFNGFGMCVCVCVCVGVVVVVVAVVALLNSRLLCSLHLLDLLFHFFSW